MSIGVVGLGRMGAAVAARLAHAGFIVYGYDAYAKDIDLTLNGIKPPSDKFVKVNTLDELVRSVAVVWLMVPAGKITDEVITTLVDLLKSGSIIIDGGNSFYQDSIRHFKECNDHDIAFLDCGTSGGLAGREEGFSLMVGGEQKSYDQCVNYLQAIAAPEGFGLVGPPGAGHYVKMVHNGIEYGILQAYAEGFHLLKDGHYDKLNLEQISGIWEHGSVIRSWLLTLIHRIYKVDQDFDDVYGAIKEGGTGRWTVEEAERHHLPVDVIKKSLEIRRDSRKTGGTYATKLVALIRNAFGGHDVTYINKGNREDAS